MCPSKSRRSRPRKKKSYKKLILALGIVAIIVVSTVAASVLSRNNNSGAGLVKVRLVTSMGDIVIELRDDMPITTGNFETLVQDELYEGTIFHRVVDGFVIQGGQVNVSVPSIPSEVIPGNNRNDRGTVAMALMGGDPNSATSQFYINLVNNNDLDSTYAVFGKVIEGMDVVDQIAQVPVDENDRPIDDVVVFVAVLED